MPALQQLQAGEHQVVAVLTQPDRPAGRGRQMQTSPVKQAAAASAIPVWQPASLRQSEIQAELAALAPDLMIVTAYGLLLPEQVLSLPRYGCWNIHASLLPRWRGAAPIQRAIEAGDETTGITIMQMDKGLDTGDMLLQAAQPIMATDTSATLHDKLAQLGALALQQCLTALVEGRPMPATAQDHEQATYAHRLSKQEAEIDWRQPAELIARRVRAFDPWPVAWADLLGKRTRIWQASVVADNAVPTGAGHTPGELSEHAQQLLVACGRDYLGIEKLQPAGSRIIAAIDWLNAHRRQLPG